MLGRFIEGLVLTARGVHTMGTAISGAVANAVRGSVCHTEPPALLPEERLELQARRLEGKKTRGDAADAHTDDDDDVIDAEVVNGPDGEDPLAGFQGFGSFRV